MRPSVTLPPEAGQIGVATSTATYANDARERRRRRRLKLQPGYTSAVLRVLSEQSPPLEGHVLNLSETGMAIDIDRKLKPGSAVTVEFCVAGLGRMRGSSWPTFAVAAEVVRLDDVDDAPLGPYKTAVRFVRLPTIVQATIARFIVSAPV